MLFWARTGRPLFVRVHLVRCLLERSCNLYAGSFDGPLLGMGGGDGIGGLGRWLASSKAGEGRIRSGVVSVSGG